MPKNYNIITKRKDLRGKSSHVVFGSSVAAGLTRYVTFVRVNIDSTLSTKGAVVFLTSTTASNTAITTTLASANAKMFVGISSSVSARKEFQAPDKIDTENPLFTIAASKWFGAYLSSVAGQSSPVDITVQYYDQ